MTVAAGQPGHQLPDPQVVRPDALQRVDRPAQHVIPAPELAGPLDRHDVLGLLDHAQHLIGAPRIPADPALLRLGHVEADRAEPHLLLDPRSAVASRLTSAGSADSTWKAIRWALFGPDAGQPAKLVDQILDRALVHRRSEAGQAEAAQASR